MASGLIYLLTIEGENKTSMLIGQTCRKLARRISQYKCDLSHGRCTNPRLQRCYHKYGWFVFSFSLIEVCSLSDLPARERFYIKYFDTFNTEHGLNLTSGGEEGKSFSDETRQKMSLQRRGRTLSLEWRKNMSIARKGLKPNFGNKHTDQTCRIIAEKLGSTEFSIVNENGVVLSHVSKQLIAKQTGMSRRHLRRLLDGEVEIAKGWRLCV